MIRLPRLSKGAKVEAANIPDVVNRLVDAVENLYTVQGDNQRIAVKCDSNGFIIRGIVKSENSEGGVDDTSSITFFPVQITGKIGGYYTVDIYANGKDNPRTATGVMQVMISSIGSTIPSGTPMMGFSNSVTITGDE